MARTANADTTPETVSGEVVVQTVIQNTLRLIDEKQRAVSAVAAARNTLHSFIEQGMASDEQVEWINNTLPRKTRVSANGEAEVSVEDDE
jgi:hypothetical protein